VRCASCVLYSVRREGQMCYGCRVGTNRAKQLEAEVADMLRAWDLHWSSYDSIVPCAGKGCLKRPDFVYLGDGWVIVIECDENHHRNYEIYCEIGRVGQLKDTLKLPLFLIRFNPGVRRYDALKRTIDDAIASGCQAARESPYGIFVAYVGYPNARVEALDEYTAGLCGMPFPGCRVTC